MRKNQKNANRDTIPFNYGFALFFVCVLIYAWVAPLSEDESERYRDYSLRILPFITLLECFWHYRLDEQGITQLYFGIKIKQILWEKTAQVGVIYTTTYAKGNGEWHIVIVPKWCELPDPKEYNGLSYIRRNRKQIFRIPRNRRNIALIEKYYGPLDFDGYPKKNLQYNK